jgi:hypothetical protein
MMYLILALDQQRIVHGDMTRRNMLYKQESNDIVMVLSDFGFTGELSPSGYHPRIGFPNLVRSHQLLPMLIEFFHLQPSVRSTRLPVHLWPFVNRWQMYFDCVYNRPTYVILSSGQCCFLPQWILCHFFKLPPSILAEFLRLYHIPKNPNQLKVPPPKRQ